MRVSTYDLQSAGGLRTVIASQPVRPLTAVETRTDREPRSTHAPAERVLEGELLRQTPITAAESILSDARSLLFARAQAVEPVTPSSSADNLSPFAVLFYQQHSSPEKLAAGNPGKLVNQFA